MFLQVCQECAFFRKGEQCDDECQPDFYYIDQEHKECLLCANECRGCTGPSAAECLTCRHYRLYSVRMVLSRGVIVSPFKMIRNRQTVEISLFFFFPLPKLFRRDDKL